MPWSVASVKRIRPWGTAVLGGAAVTVGTSGIGWPGATVTGIGPRSGPDLRCSTGTVKVRSVAAGATASAVGALLLSAWMRSPLYVATMAWTPTGIGRCREAFPAVNGTVASIAASWAKETDPVGGASTPRAPETSAVKVTACPKTGWGDRR